jgi:hypothetical protein
MLSFNSIHAFSSQEISSAYMITPCYFIISSLPVVVSVVAALKMLNVVYKMFLLPPGKLNQKYTVLKVWQHVII